MRSPLPAGALILVVLLSTSLVSPTAVFAQGEIIETIAGGGPDGLPATSVELYPTAILADPAGGFYLATWDYLYHARIYKVDASGALTLVAGTGRRGVGVPASGDGGPAVNADLAAVLALVLDPSGNLYAADTSFQRIRRIDAATGTFATVAGNVGGLLFGLVRSAAGDLHVSSSTSHWVRRIDAATGVQTTITGTGVAGFSGDGGPATAAQLSSPSAIAFDGDENLYIADRGNRRVRKVDASTGNISTVAGTGNPGFEGDGGPATSANFYMDFSVGLTLDDSGNLFIADWQDIDGPWRTRIRRVDATTGIIDLYAGDGSATGEGIPAIGAEMGEIWALDVDPAGDLLIADAGNFTFGFGARARKIVASTGLLYTIAGGGSSDGEGGPALNAVITNLTGIAAAPSGDICLSNGDADRAKVSRVDAVTGTITKVAGGAYGYNGDGIPATSAWLRQPRGLAVDPAGHLFIADSFNHRIRRVDATTGIITTYAGNGTAGSGGDGMKATMANLNQPYDVALDAAGYLYIADMTNHKVRVVNPVNGKIGTFAGNGTAGFGGDGGLATAASLRNPQAVALDAAGNVFIADTTNNRVRRVDAVTSIITTVAGNGTGGYGGDGGPAIGAQLGSVESLDVDADGDILLVDRTNHRIRKVDMATGIIDTVAGTGVRAFGGDGGPPTLAYLDNPFGVAVEASGSYVIGDNLRIRRISSTSAPTEAGEAEDGNPSSESPLSISKAPYGMITLSWGSSCYASDSDFEVYEGAMGSFASHAPRSCGTGNAASLTFTPVAGSAYYLVVPRSYAREGSYGLDGDGLERPASLTACLAQEVAACP